MIPLATRTRTLSTLRANRPAAIAASGITVTTSPAAAGDIRQPFTSSSTSRKSAATRPPDRSSRPRFAPMCGRPAGSGSGRHAKPRTASSDTSAIGACSRKIHSQPSVAVRTPPIAGPSAAPSTPAVAQILAAASRRRPRPP